MISTSKQNNFFFETFNSECKEIGFVSRPGETRIGDFNLSNPTARFVILGIEESVGPIANQGNSGSENAFRSFMRVFLNSQVYPEFKIDSISILGSIRHKSPNTFLENTSELVAELDVFVVQILKDCVSANQIPIVIGGGHNNSYPLIKWISQFELINVINLDPHADCRETNERHSGNSFSFALQNKLITEYVVLGLHEGFNNSFIRQFLKQNKVEHTFFEDYLVGKQNLIQDALQVIQTWNEAQKRIGIEIDMDCIANMPSSAVSPSGWTLDQVRSYLIHISSNARKVAYLHLPEAAPKNEVEAKMVGKALTYLVRDFIQHLV